MRFLRPRWISDDLKLDTEDQADFEKDLGDWLENNGGIQNDKERRKSSKVENKER